MISPDLPPFPQPLVLAGPTASGKSSVAAALAARLGGEVVNADPFQAWRGMEVLTAQPEARERALVPHHLYGVLDPGEDRDAAGFSGQVREAVDALARRGIPAVVVSGSGLYLRALAGGLDDTLPAPDPVLRARLEARSLVELLEELDRLDPVEARRIDRQNPRRVLRALEICLQTGQPVSGLRRRRDETGPVPVAGVVLCPEAEELKDRIARRAAAMLGPKLREELQALDGQELSRTAARTLGLETVRAWRDGRIGQAEAARLLTTETWQYARRQRTWFQKAREFLPIRVGLDATPETIAAGILECFARPDGRPLPDTIPD